MRKKIKLALMTLIFAVTTANACGGKGNGNSGAAKTSGGMVKFEDYVQVDKNPKGEYIGDFNLVEYLEAYGAQDIWRVEFYRSDTTQVRARFKNGIHIALNFNVDPNNRFEYPHLDNISIYAATDEYKPETITELRHEQDLTTGKRSEWSRAFETASVELFTNDGEYKKKHATEHSYVVNPDRYFYAVWEYGEYNKRTLVCVPEYFDAGFKADVLPYLALEEPSFREDPLKDTDIGGQIVYKD